MAAEWRLRVDGRVTEPLDETVARSMARENPGAFAWRPGFDGWKPVEEVADFRAAPGAGSAASIPEAPGTAVPSARETGDGPKRRLLNLIQAAAGGDEDAQRALLDPFLAEGEALLEFGLSAKMGILTTYDFYFVTNLRVGDLEVTPFTGALNVEAAFIRDCPAFVLNQPSIPITLRLWFLGMYLVSAGFAFVLVMFPPVFFGLLGGDRPLALILGAFAFAGLAYVVHHLLIPGVKRAFLRFRKSGVFVMTSSGGMGILVFADRDRFGLMASLTRRMVELRGDR